MSTTATATKDKIITIDGKEFTLALTMQSFVTYEEMRGVSLMSELYAIVEKKHEQIIALMASMLWEDGADKPVGAEIYSMNAEGLALSNVMLWTLNRMFESIPQVSDSPQNKKKD